MSCSSKELKIYWPRRSSIDNSILLPFTNVWQVERSILKVREAGISMQTIFEYMSAEQFTIEALKGNVIEFSRSQI